MELASIPESASIALILNHLKWNSFKPLLTHVGQTSKSYMLEAHWDHCVPLDVYAQNIAQEEDMHSAWVHSSYESQIMT